MNNNLIRELDAQPPPLQALIGAFLGMLFVGGSQAALSLAPVAISSSVGMGLIAGGAICGAILYIAIYRFWQWIK